MTILYRAVSEFEMNDYELCGQFRTARNTLEGKQFFKSHSAVLDFVNSAVKQNYFPPYRFLLIISVDTQKFDHVTQKNLTLDGFDAVSIHDDYLPDFNNCVTFVEQSMI